MLVTKHVHAISVAGEHLHAEDLLPEHVHSKTTLVFLHDAIGSVSQWRGYPEEVVAQTGCKGLVFDRRGYGRSSGSVLPRPVSYLVDAACQDLPLVLRACDIQDVILIGHSDGGSIALAFGANCPSDITLRGLITEAAHVFVEDITLFGIRTILELTSTTPFLSQLKRFHGDKTDAVFRAWHETWLSPAYRTWDIQAHLPKITTPLLVIQGADDEYGTLAQVDAIANGVQGPCETLVPSGCAHIPHYQAHDVVLTRMVDFINRHKTAL